VAALARHLPEPLRTQTLHQALEAARSIESEHYRSSALPALAAQLHASPLTPLYQHWTQTLPGLASRTRHDLLSDLRSLLPIILRLGVPQAVCDLFHAIQDVGRWWP
jgi:hypothetical protein